MPIYIGYSEAKCDGGRAGWTVEQVLPGATDDPEIAAMWRRVREREEAKRAALPPLSVRLSRMALDAARLEALREQGLEASLSAPVVAAPLSKVDEQSAPPVPDWRAAMFSGEAIAYLGLGHLDRPDNALNRMMAQGVLQRRKLGGKLIFRREDLDRVLNEGSPIRTGRRGRPKGSRNRRYQSPPAVAG